ncbi:MAG: hypothetical protein IMZ53_10395, partial [Thermoplasmata archaeon]|nr:hypothetical protein [Thermoplasmata archaeon]
MVRRKKSRWSKKAKIVTTIGIIIAICAGVFATIYITNPSMLSMPQGYFGLFGAGDYNTGLSLNTETQYFKDTGVEGYGGLLSPVYYRLITGGYGPIVKITAQGGMTVEQNRPPEQFWIDPYMIDKIDGYWYEVYWKNSTTDWTKIIDKTNTRSWWAVHYEEAIGTGFQTGWTMPLGASHRFECNPITFWVRCSDKGCGVKVELHAKISWTVGGMSQRTEGKDDVLLASDEAYGTQQPPQQAQPTAPKLTITTTPGASVQVSGQEIKTADEL